jgi:hypothetical protein
VSRAFNLALKRHLDEAGLDLATPRLSVQVVTAGGGTVAESGLQLEATFSHLADADRIMPPILQVAVDQVPMLVAVDPGDMQPRAARRHFQRTGRLHRQGGRQDLEHTCPY